MNNLYLLAQQEASETIEGTPINGQQQQTAITKQSSDPNDMSGQPKSFWGQYGQLIFIVLIFVVMYFVLLRGPKKRQQEHKQMVQTLKKNDRVRTIGGIIGTIVDIKDDEITLKVDESSNTKMHVVPSAIATNLSGSKKENA